MAHYILGVTSYLLRRVYEHKTADIQGFTQKYGLHSLVYYELHATMESAIHREKRLKKYIKSTENTSD